MAALKRDLTACFAFLLSLQVFVTLTVVQAGSYNYAQLLGLSYSFYEAQQTGVLPAWNRHNVKTSPTTGWKSDSYTDDGSSMGKDLSGGWFDAGDHIKFGLPYGWTVSTLAWGMVEFEETYRSTGTWLAARNNLEWAVDWMVKAHIKASDHPAENVYVAQVGDFYTDHSKWCRAEDWRTADCTVERPVFTASAASPGANIVAHAAGSMAAMAYILRRDEPASTKATALLARAKQLYAFAKAYPGGWKIGAGRTNPYESGMNTAEDEMFLAAAFMCYVEGPGSSSCTQELPAAWQAADRTSWTYHTDWDSSSNIALILAASAPGSPQQLRATFLERVTLNLKNWDVDKPCPDGTPAEYSVCYSPKGVAHLLTWGPLRHSANTAMLRLMLARYVNTEAEAKKQRCWGYKQMNLALGDWGRSFVVGFGTDPPVRPHHRDASCPSDLSQPCGQADYTLPGPNPSGPVGALVGGPDRHDVYADVRGDWIANEVAVDYNAGYTTALAALADFTAKLGSTSWAQYCGAPDPTPQATPTQTPTPTPTTTSTPTPTPSPVSQPKPTSPQPPSPPPKPPAPPPPPPAVCPPELWYCKKCNELTASVPAALQPCLTCAATSAGASRDPGDCHLCLMAGYKPPGVVKGCLGCVARGITAWKCRAFCAANSTSGAQTKICSTCLEGRTDGWGCQNCMTRYPADLKRQAECSSCVAAGREAWSCGQCGKLATLDAMRACSTCLGTVTDGDYDRCTKP